MLFVIPLVLYTFESRKPIDSFRVLPPFLLATAAYFVVRSLVIQTQNVDLPNDIINNSLYGAESIAERTATTVALLGEYVRLLIVPYPLSWDYSYNHFPLLDWSSTKALGALAFHLFLAYWAIKRLKFRNVVAFCILFYALTMAITSNVFFLNGSILGERFLFMPSWAFCMLIPILLAKGLSRDPKKGMLYRKTVRLGVLSTLILLGTVMTINRNGDWKNNLSLFEAGVKAAPNSARAHASLAFEYKLEALSASDEATGRAYFQKSESAFARSLEIYPAFEYALYNVGVLYLDVGALDKAVASFQNLLKVYPNHEGGLNNVGVSYFRQQRYLEAISYFDRLLDVNPSHHQALTNIGASYFNLNEMSKALPYYERALELQQGNSATYSILARIHRALGQPELAAHYTALKESLD